MAEVAPEQCPEPFWHRTHRYCPRCTWTESPATTASSEAEPSVDVPAAPISVAATWPCRRGKHRLCANQTDCRCVCHALDAANERAERAEAALREVAQRGDSGGTEVDTVVAVAQWVAAPARAVLADAPRETTCAKHTFVRLVDGRCSTCDRKPPAAPGPGWVEPAGDYVQGGNDDAAR